MGGDRLPLTAWSLTALQTTAKPGLVPSTVPSVSSGKRALIPRDKVAVILPLLSSYCSVCAFSPSKERENA